MVRFAELIRIGHLHAISGDRTGLADAQIEPEKPEKWTKSSSNEQIPRAAELTICFWLRTEKKNTYAVRRAVE